ncbi:MAG: GNAT family N-acetyltransferase [Acidiphilium sp. 21-60-14]|nr:MAG: GNAT family N-acetyltransferase [Acidiphilium sp. 21-60-14]OYV89765.1 MAG: GNAT family N-acetyltransferase [Acidiphilium sp. 37-60-79]OZB39558.1 MAG: GNAT family N-acetyltransferase [Acidiphilium sp. 34-60-192]HQU24765.1 GNAT family N-acetyltransferase [Acidiphilium sp.]
MPDFALRPAALHDVTALLGLVHDLAIYERAPNAVEMTAPMLQHALFGERKLAQAVLAERVPAEGEAILGFALYFTSFSTWTGKAGLYLEDLFVKPAARGQGIGKALLRYLAAEAVDRNCARLEWQVLDWNQPAIDFYKSLGAEPLDDWTRYRVNGAALNALASQETNHG